MAPPIREPSIERSYMGNALNSKRPSDVQRNNSFPPPSHPPLVLSVVSDRKILDERGLDASMGRFRSDERRPLIFFHEWTPLCARVANRCLSCHAN